MSPVLIGLILLAIFFVIMFLGMPISFSMLIIGFLGVSIYTSVEVAFNMVSINLFEQFSQYSFIVIPMYIWMGHLAYESGLGTKLYNMANKWIGHFSGGLAMATQVASAIFGAICGSILAAVATIGSISVPEMKRYNYDMKLATASVAAGGILGVLIPPSVVLMIYGIATQTSIRKLFQASIVPGIILMFLYIGVIFILTKRNPDIAPKSEEATWKERIDSLKGGLWEVIVVFLLSLGGMFAGWFTPSEAGSIGAAGVLVITVLEGSLKWDGIKRSLYETARATGMILLLIAGATIFGRFLALSTLTAKAANWAGGLPFPPYIVMLIILFIYLVLGCFIDIPALVLMTIPISFPVVVNTLGYDALWFGVIMLMIQGMGAITPPVGMSVYVMSDIAKDVPLKTIFSGIWPFLAAIIVCSLILLAFPQIATFIVR